MGKITSINLNFGQIHGIRDFVNFY